MRSACAGLLTSPEKCPNLLPLLPLLPLSALLAGFGVALDGPVALGVASSSCVLPSAFALPARFSFPVALVATFLGIFRKVILEPDLSSVRPASIPAAASKRPRQ
jgi:hypothetical protein